MVKQSTTQLHGPTKTTLSMPMSGRHNCTLCCSCIYNYVNYYIDYWYPFSCVSRYTENKETMSVYALFLKWPTNYNLELGSIYPTPNSTVTLLGYPTPLKWEVTSPTILVKLPSFPLDSTLQWGWALKFH